ncbi:MAG: histidine kinase [Candidatus Krumholzibacteria bacterium]|nr:histidine kinase [Candidatus Krumholzibacteria bacterium]
MSDRLLAPEQLLLINLLLRVVVMAGIASLVLSFRFVNDSLVRASLSMADRLRMIVLLSVIFIVGVVVRKLIYQGAMDLSLEGALFAGFLGGVWVGSGVGAAIGAACFLFGEKVALPYYAMAGFVSGALVSLLRERGEIWNFSFNPFSILYNFFERLSQRRLDRNFVPFATCLVFAAARYGLLRRFQGRRLFYGYLPSEKYLMALDLAVLVYTLGIALKMANNARIELLLREEERQLIHARIATLRSQINPHFLFNTLNSISALIRTDAEKAREMTRQLASIFRKSLDDSGETHALRDEIAFIDDYLSIERVRFGDERLVVIKDIDPAALDAQVPVMILQPIVENAIKHGISRRVDGGLVRIEARRTEKGLAIEIENDGPPVPDCKIEELTSKGVGLKNVIERIAIQSSGGGSLTIEPGRNGGAVVRLELPADTRMVD